MTFSLIDIWVNRELPFGRNPKLAVFFSPRQFLGKEVQVRIYPKMGKRRPSPYSLQMQVSLEGIRLFFFGLLLNLIFPFGFDCSLVKQPLVCMAHVLQ